MRQINYLKREINISNLKNSTKNPKSKGKIDKIYNEFSLEICSDLPNAFSDRKTHVVPLPYVDEFSENNVPTKARPCPVNSEYLESCRKEISLSVE